MAGAEVEARLGEGSEFSEGGESQGKRWDRAAEPPITWRGRQVQATRSGEPVAQPRH